MIFNSAVCSDIFTYHCNNKNDDIALLTFIANLRKKGYSHFTVLIAGTFKKSATGVITLNNTGSMITLDFSRCDVIQGNGAFIYAQNVRIYNACINYSGVTGDAINVFDGVGSVFESCQVYGELSATECNVFAGTDNIYKGCICSVTNNTGLIYGVAGSGHNVGECNIKVSALAASAYGCGASAVYVENSRFEGRTESSDVTASGSGGVGGGYFCGCRFVGIGALKGYGFYARAGTWLTMINCACRGYTKANTAEALGIGITGAVSDATTLSLLGISCNQIDLDGYLQTDSMIFNTAYGVASGTFYKTPTLGTNITSLGTFARNRT